MHVENERLQGENDRLATELGRTTRLAVAFLTNMNRGQITLSEEAVSAFDKGPSPTICWKPDGHRRWTFFVGPAKQ